MSLNGVIVKTLDMAVRAQIIEEGPQIEDDDERIVYVNRQLAQMSHVEFLERISDAFTSMTGVSKEVP